MQTNSDSRVDKNESGQIQASLPKHAYPDGPRSLKSLFAWLSGAIKIYMVVELLVTFSWGYLLWLHLPGVNASFSYEQQTQIDIAVGLIVLLQAIVMLAYAFLACRVTYRAMRNLHTISSKKAEMSPKWAVLWYFIPIANFWKPAEGMSQIYHGTHAAMGEKSAANSPIPVWWTFWLLSYFCSFLGGVASEFNGHESYEYSSVTFGFDIAASVCNLLSVYALLRLLQRVVERQEAFRHGGVMTVFD